jgi:hypothetical protein
MPTKSVDYYFYVNGVTAAIAATAYNTDDSGSPAFQQTFESAAEFQTGTVQLIFEGADSSFGWDTTTAPAVSANAVINVLTGRGEGGTLEDMMNTPSVVGTDFALSYGFYDSGWAAGDLTRDDQAYAYLTPAVSGWMGQLAGRYPQVKQLPFCQFALPGAHDAGTFDLTTVKALIGSLDAAGALLDVVAGSAAAGAQGVVGSQVLTAVTNLAVTQKDDVVTMLDLGCRYFDFRPGYALSLFRSLAPGIDHQHTAVPGYPFLSFLTDVLQWLAANPAEIVVVGANNQGFLSADMTPPEQALSDVLAQAQQATKSTIGIGTAGDLSTTYGDLVAANTRLIFLNQISGWYPAGKYDSYSDAAYATTNPQSILDALEGMTAGGQEGSNYTVLQLQGTATASGDEVVASTLLSPSNAASPLMSTKALFDSNTYPWLSANVARNLSSQYLVVFLNDFIDSALALRAIAVTMQRMGLS